MDLQLVERNSLNNESICELQLTDQFSTKKDEICCKIKNKMSGYAQVIITIANNNKIKLQKKVLYDMAKMVSFLEKFGENAKIWID